jgi:hypothetical protein
MPSRTIFFSFPFSLVLVLGLSAIVLSAGRNIEVAGYLRVPVGSCSLIFNLLHGYRCL